MIAQNRKARHDYFIEETYEAGIALVGTEVKSLRSGKASIGESHAHEQDGEIFIINAHIPEYTQGNRNNHYPRRPRKLLLHKRQISKLIGLVNTKGITLVPLSFYFNKRNIVKVELAIARGKKKHDKREAMKDRDWGRKKERLLKEG